MCFMDPVHGLNVESKRAYPSHCLFGLHAITSCAVLWAQDCTEKNKPNILRLKNLIPTAFEEVTVTMS